MRYIIVTGANKGIGLAVVQAILSEQPDFGVFLGSRDATRGTAAAESLLSARPEWSGRLQVLTLDVGDDRSVREAASRLSDQLGDEPPPLHGLVNNAGLAAGSLGEILDVNLHGIRRTCAAFAPLIADGGRVVNVTSAAAPNFVAGCDAARKAFFLDPKLSWEQLEQVMQQCEQLGPTDLDSLGMGSDSSYGLSKACANSYTQILAREYPRLSINACTPGFIETDLGRDFLGDRSPTEAGMKTPAEGARVILRLLFGEPPGSGHYFGSDSLRSPMDRYRAPGSPAYTGE
jgi:NAD(P)-dependent dehydrogenase (short-subunit alcohol dehydrogenase family)